MTSGAKKMWEDLCEVMKTSIPRQRNRPQDLPLTHPIFDGVFKLDHIPQVPSHDAAKRWMELGIDNHYEHSVIRKGAMEIQKRTSILPHFRAWLDDRGRIMMLACHNNDLADGWEEESYEPWFFKKYSEKVCFPYWDQHCLLRTDALNPR